MHYERLSRNMMRITLPDGKVQMAVYNRKTGAILWDQEFKVPDEVKREARSRFQNEISNLN